MGRPSHPVVAALLDPVMRPLDKVRARVVPRASGRVLELGVGTGLNLPHYDPRCAVVGVEPDPHMLRRAERRRAAWAELSVTLHDAGAEDLPFDNDSFDCVVATFVLCTIPAPDRALSEARRVLRPGGVLLFAEHVRSRGGPEASLQRALTPMWRHVAGGCRLDVDAPALIEAAGFRVEERRAHGLERWTVFPVMSGRAVLP